MSAYGTVLEALADPTRRKVFERLRRGPLAVGELTSGLQVSRPAVSQHLKALLDSGLVNVEQVGTRRFYSIEPDGLAELRQWVDSFWDLPLARFKESAERHGRGRNSNKR